jgi:hypothetical protein
MTVWDSLRGKVYNDCSVSMTKSVFHGCDDKVMSKKAFEEACRTYSTLDNCTFYRTERHIMGLERVCAGRQGGPKDR